jgi:membrane associated rhomboid family serine protease
MATCYRHPGRETGVSCSSCGRPICPDCMTPTPVGMRCPECSRRRTQVHTLASTTSEPRVTIAIIVACGIAFLASAGTDRLVSDYSLFGPAISSGHEYWRLVTGGFLHAGLLHIGFNMYLLWVLGQRLEPELGSPRFAALYATALLWGSFGALLVTPDAVTVGASGAVFGLMGAMAVELRARGVNPLQSDIGVLILFNLGLSLVLSNVSIGGHVGGLIGGALVGGGYELARRRRSPALGYAICALLAVAAVIGAVAVAGR